MEMVATTTARVVHLIASSGLYGAERVVANLAGALPGTRPLVFCQCRKPEYVSAFRNTVEKSGANFYTASFGLRNALHELKSCLGDEPCILHVHGYRVAVLALMFKAMQQMRGIKAPVFVTQHGFTAQSRKGEFYNVISKVICRWLPIARVIGVSSPIIDICLKFGIAPTRLVLIPNGTQCSPQIPKSTARALMAERYKLDTDQPWLGFAGRFSAEKNPLLFVSICAELARNGTRCLGLMAGEGPQAEAIQQQVRDNNVESQVRELGFVADMQTFLAALDFLVVPSLTEGTPMVVLESMWQKTPVIAAQVGGLPDIISNGEDGLLVEGHDARHYANQLIQWLSQADLLAGMRDNAARKIQEHFSVEKQALSYVSLYNAGVQNET